MARKTPLVSKVDMARYGDLTKIELIAYVVNKNSQIENLSGHNNRLAASLAEVEPALAKASEELAKLRTDLDTLQKAKDSAEANFNQAVNERDAWRKEAHLTHSEAQGLQSDLIYEKGRRVSAENKLFDLETRLHNTLNSEYPPNEVKERMSGLHIDRNGEIA